MVEVWVPDDDRPEPCRRTLPTLSILQLLILSTLLLLPLLPLIKFDNWDKFSTNDLMCVLKNKVNLAITGFTKCYM